MKVAFLGNVNNHPFIVCKHLREKGVDTIFFVEASKENMLYRPEATGFVEYPYPDWIIEVPQFQQSKVIHLPQLYARDVIKRINTCDAVILNDFGHRLMPFLRKGMIKISMFTGGDLDIMADFGIVEYMKLKSAKLQFIPAFIRKIFARQTVHQLRKAIAGADLVAYYPEGLHKAGDQILKEIFGNKPYKKYSHWCLMLDGIVYKPPPPHTAGKKIKVLNLARFMWKEPFPAGRSPLENKRNDIMIRGIGNFLKSHPGSLDIHFVDKGIDVKESKALIEEYGYSNDVTWHDNMPLKDIIIEIEKADIVFDQLGNHLFGAGVISMAVGRPLIANGRLDILKQVSEGEIPVCHAASEEEVVEWLEKLVFDEALRIKTGKASSVFSFRFMDIRNESDYYYEFIQQQMAAGQKQ